MSRLSAALPPCGPIALSCCKMESKPSDSLFESRSTHKATKVKGNSLFIFFVIKCCIIIYYLLKVVNCQPVPLFKMFILLHYTPGSYRGRGIILVWSIFNHNDGSFAAVSVTPFQLVHLLTQRLVLRAQCLILETEHHSRLIFHFK